MKNINLLGVVDRSKDISTYYDNMDNIDEESIKQALLLLEFYPEYLDNETKPKNKYNNINTDDKARFINLFYSNLSDNISINLKIILVLIEFYSDYVNVNLDIDEKNIIKELDDHYAKQLQKMIFNW